MVAWRYWRVSDDGRLASPHAGNVLGDDGTLTANPTPGGTTGVYHYPDHRDIMAVMNTLNPEVFAATAGVITGPVYLDWNPPKYRVGHTLVTLPAGRRCSTYRVIRIYSDIPIHHYGIPVQPLSHLRTGA